MTSRTALVRAEALRVLPATTPDVALNAFTDRHRLVRAVAQEALRRHGIDPAAGYRDLIKQSPPAPAVIAGLGETGNNEDGALIRPWLSHPQARGRVEAIRALRRWAAAEPAELVALLRDDSAAVTCQAATTLMPWAAEMDPQPLHALLQPNNPPHVRLAGYGLLVAGNTWQRLATNVLSR